MLSTCTPTSSPNVVRIGSKSTEDEFHAEGFHPTEGMRGEGGGGLRQGVGWAGGGKNPSVNRCENIHDFWSKVLRNSV